MSRVILGTKYQYHNQLNNAQVALFKDYFNKKKAIACGPTALAEAFEIAGWPTDVFTPGEQADDAILMILQNPKNLKRFKKIRNLDYDKYPPNEIPQLFPEVGRILYEKEVCRFEWGLSFEIIKDNILQGITMIICGKFPAGGHYVHAVGFDDEKQVIIFNDPYPKQ